MCGRAREFLREIWKSATLNAAELYVVSCDVLFFQAPSLSPPCSFSLLYSSKPFMNIPSVPGGNGPIFDTRYCRRKILQNLVRGIGWLAAAPFGAPPPPHDHPTPEGK